MKKYNRENCTTNKWRTECFHFQRQTKDGRKLDNKRTNGGRNVFTSYHKNKRWEKVGQQTNEWRTECFYFLRQIKDGRELDNKRTNGGRNVFTSYHKYKMGESWTTNQQIEDGMFLLPTTNKRRKKVGQQTNEWRTECFYFLRQINERESFHFL